MDLQMMSDKKAAGSGASRKHGGKSLCIDGRSGLRLCGHMKSEGIWTYIVMLGLSLSNLIRVQSEAGGDPTEPNVPQHVLVICHASSAPGGT